MIVSRGAGLASEMISYFFLRTEPSGLEILHVLLQGINGDESLMFGTLVMRAITDEGTIVVACGGDLLSIIGHEGNCLDTLLPMLVMKDFVVELQPTFCTYASHGNNQMTGRMGGDGCGLRSRGNVAMFLTILVCI